MIDFSTWTTDDLLRFVTAEDGQWEFKSAKLLERSSKDEFVKKLSQQISAFANSGGGNLVFGLSDSRAIEPCEQSVGRQPMKDYLATMVETSVDYPLRHFKVHRIPFADDNTQSVFIIEIFDSPAAPHQAKIDKIYYYRIDGHTKPAPHFHVELLRQRETRAIIEAGEPEWHIEKFIGTDSALIEVIFVLPIRNVSLQAATSWGVLIEHTNGDDRWAIRPTSQPLDDARCFTGFPVSLLPYATTRLSIPLIGRANHELGPIDAAFDLWKCISLKFLPVTHNHVGQPTHFGNWGDKIREKIAINEFKLKLKPFV